MVNFISTFSTARSSSRAISTLALRLQQAKRRNALHAAFNAKVKLTDLILFNEERVNN